MSKGPFFEVLFLALLTLKRTQCNNFAVFADFLFLICFW